MHFKDDDFMGWFCIWLLCIVNFTSCGSEFSHRILEFGSSCIPQPIHLHSCDKPIVYCIFYCKVEGFPILELLPALTYLYGYIFNTRHSWKKYYGSVRITMIRLTSFGQWSQLWELGIIWFCTSQIAHFQKAFKLESCALYSILLSSEFRWMKNLCKSHFYMITIAIWYYVLSCLIKILCDLFKVTNV